MDDDRKEYNAKRAELWDKIRAQVAAGKPVTISMDEALEAPAWLPCEVNEVTGDG